MKVKDQQPYILDNELGSREEVEIGVPPTFREFCTLSKIRHEKSQKPVR